MESSCSNDLRFLPNERRERSVARLLPQAVLATGMVAVAPAAAAFELEYRGIITMIPAIILCAALTLLSYHAAAAVWQRRQGSHDVLFGELMLWGWASRLLRERRISADLAQLGSTAGCDLEDDAALTDQHTGLLQRVASDLETRDPYTHGHSRRVARYAGLTAEQMGITGDRLRRIRTAAVIHDIGKIDTPIDVLCKPAALTADEFELIKRHPIDGERLVRILEDEEISAIVRSHHERLDGSGYPDAIYGEQIPLGARIVAVVDTFDAITSTRPYRSARTHKQALDIIQADAGVKLDAEAVEAFRRGYLARRPIAAWIAISELADRALLWLFGDALGSGVRLVAISAGAVALSSHLMPPGATFGSRPTEPLSASPFQPNPGSSTLLAGVAPPPAGHRHASRRHTKAVRPRAGRHPLRQVSSKAAQGAGGPVIGNTGTGSGTNDGGGGSAHRKAAGSGNNGSGGAGGGAGQGLGPPADNSARSSPGRWRWRQSWHQLHIRPLGRQRWWHASDRRQR